MVRELKHTEIGDIPIDWEIQTFEETFKILSNNTLSRENLNNRGGAVRNIHYGDILTQFSEVLKCNDVEIPYINDLSLLSSSTQLLQDGDLIIADTAEDETVGKVTEVQGLGDGKMVAGLHTIPCRVKKGDFAPGWLGYYMNSHMYHDQIMPFITGIKVSSISKSAIAETLIVIPPVDEQKQIVKILSQIDILIQKEKKVAEKIMAAKRGCLSKMFPKDGECVPEMRFPGFCGDWEQCKVSELCSISTGKSNTQDKVEDGEYPFYVRSPIIERSTKYLYDEEAVLTVGDGVGTGKVFHYVNGKYDLHQRCYRMYDFTDALNARYFYHTFSKFFYKRVMAMTAKTSVDSVRLEMIADMEIPCPDIKEQEQIGAFFTNLDTLITLHQRKCEKYIGIKSALISTLISAKKQT